MHTQFSPPHLHPKRQSSFLGGMLMFFLRLGVVQGTVVITAIAICLSVLMVSITLKWLAAPGTFYLPLLSISLIIPALVGPYTSYWILRLLREIEKTREIAHQLSITDELTQAYSRRLFFELATEELTRAHRYHRPFAIILLDIDHLAQINQTYGHLGGDHVLRFCSDACQNRLRTQDIFARYGGGQFVLVLPETDLDGTVTMAERIRSQIEAHIFVWSDQIIPVTISLGIATLQESSATIETLLRQADEALKMAKDQGKNQVQFARQTP